MEPEDEQAQVYEALRQVSERLRKAHREPLQDEEAIAAMLAEQAGLRKRLEELSEEVRARSILAAEEEQARIIAKIILK